MLRWDDVRKRFGATQAVDGLTLHVRRGEVLGLLGPNGAGKTTSISMALGLLRPDSGTVRLEGEEARGERGGPPTAPAVRRLVGVAPQALAVYDELTGRENLRFFGGLYGLRGAALARRVDACLDLVNLSDRAGDRAGVYSGGMKRRLNLAAALVHDPPLLLLDEPTAGVDPQSRNALFEVVGRLRDEGRTVVYSTHYMEEAERLCDRVGIIDHGKLLALDTVPNLLEAHGGSSVVVLVRGGVEERIESADPVATLAAAMAGGRAASARIEGPKLETAFLKLTGRTLRD